MVHTVKAIFFLYCYAPVLNLLWLYSIGSVCFWSLPLPLPCVLWFISLCVFDAQVMLLALLSEFLLLAGRAVLAELMALSPAVQLEVGMPCTAEAADPLPSLVHEFFLYNTVPSNSATAGLTATSRPV